MRYLSVCSGIEAASVAWHHLGWQPVGFSEIEPFPSAVLAHRFPNVPNLGDMTRHAEWPLGPGSVDLLVGGTPCQSFSVAGLRKGLSDPRGGLMLTYLEIAQRLRPRWIVWENVPGVLSSGRGRDLGAFLGALGELGYGWAYRVLDAQWVRVDRWPKAVPQRRRRVFVVGCLGDPTAAAQVLFERESVCRDSSSRRASREGAAAAAEAGVGAGCYWDGSDCAGTLTKQNANGAQRMPDKDNFGAVLQPVGYRWQNDRDGLVEDGTAPACRASTGSSGFHEMNHPVIAQPVAFRKSRRAQSVNDHETRVAAEEANTLNQFDTGERDTHAVAYGMTTYKTPKFAEEVQPTLTVPSPTGGGQPPAVAQAMTVMSFHPLQDPIPNTDGSTHCMGTGGSQGNASIAVAIGAFKAGQGAKAGSIGYDEHVSPTLSAADSGTNRTPAVAVSAMVNMQGSKSNSCVSTDGSSFTLNAMHGHDMHAVAQAMTVRRLTPTECSRLQGFPDDWTLIPWRGKPADQCPDGPRYRALGNSMAVNVMAWIGERIDNYERTGNAVRTEG